MKKVECVTMQDFNGSIRKYFNFEDIRIMLVNHYDDREDWHKHETTAQIIFIIEGSIEVHQEEKESIILVNNEFIQIPAGEWHKVLPKTKTTKLLVLKYKSNNINIIEELKNDYVKK